MIHDDAQGWTSADTIKQQQQVIDALYAEIERQRKLLQLQAQMLVDDRFKHSQIWQENERLKAEVDLLNGEVKAAETRSGMANVVAQYEAQLKAERALPQPGEVEP